MLPKVNTILYATDLKEKGNKNAFRMAVSLATCSNAQIIVLHVMEPISPTVRGALRSTLSEEELENFRTTGFDNLRKELHQKIERFCQSECESQENFTCQKPIVEVDEGAPDEVIIGTAKKYSADIIVMGSRTHSAIGQVLLGSTANKVIHHNKIPVLVYPL